MSVPLDSLAGELRIRGRVLNQDGEPVANVMVFARRPVHALRGHLTGVGLSGKVLKADGRPHEGMASVRCAQGGAAFRAPLVVGTRFFQ